MPSPGLRRVSVPAIGLAVALVVTATVFGGNSSSTCDQPAVATAPRIDLDVTAATERLAQAVRFRTISDEDPRAIDPQGFIRLHNLLLASYPTVRRTLHREVINRHSVLLTWKGTDTRAKPILLMAHLDVVPVEQGTENEWIHPPFAGHVADGYVWGRGTLDDKSSVLGIMEALEFLAGQGFRPRRTVYIAFGHDEESRGPNGAAAIAAVLKSRGVTLEYLLDEGLAVADGFIRGLKVPVAMVGTAEKGWLTLELTTTQTGGHASMPPAHTSIGILASAIHHLEARPVPAAIKPPVSELLGCIAPEMPVLPRLAFSHLGVFGPLVEHQLARSSSTNALIRTTTAVTIAKAGTKDNILPASATAVVNFRVLPGESTTSVTDYAHRVISDPRVKIKALKREEPSPVSATDADGYRTLGLTIRQLFPDAIVAPALVVVRTDSSHFLEITDDTYRFRPLRFKPADVSMIHGTNERIAIDSYATMIRFYVQFLRNAAS